MYQLDPIGIFDVDGEHVKNPWGAFCKNLQQDHILSPGATSFSTICPPKGGDWSCDLSKDLELGAQKDPKASLHSGFAKDPVL
jgi:hypothetical protein